MIRAIITDFDGTLVDTFDANLKAYQKAFGEVGVVLSEEKYRECFGFRFDRFMEVMGISEKETIVRIKSLKKDYYPLFFESLHPNDALIELIRSFKCFGGKTAIASTARKENLMNALKYLGIVDLFDLIYTGQDVENGKPSPEIYDKTMAELQVQPSDTLIFEDSEVGLQAAKASGAYFILEIMEIEVKGHSGCQIDVVSEEGQIFVYKSTADPLYLNRLALQAEKQRNASLIEFQHIRVPLIYELKRTDKKTIVKMQYVYSKNFIEFFEQAGFEQIDYLVGALKYFIEYEINKCKLQVVSPQIFRAKFDDIRMKLEKNAFFQQDAQVVRIIEDCQSYFGHLQEMLLPIGVCHGDLTFSNILFNGNNYYLIDFLDSFIETPLQDIVKIRQDTAYRWSQLMYTKRYDAVRLGIICDKIDHEIDLYFSNKYQWYTDHYRTVQLMNILRILPYAHEEKVVCYLKNILNSLLHE